jgi:hypothetical protein
MLIKIISNVSRINLSLSVYLYLSVGVKKSRSTRILFIVCTSLANTLWNIVPFQALWIISALLTTIRLQFNVVPRTIVAWTPWPIQRRVPNSNDWQLSGRAWKFEILLEPRLAPRILSGGDTRVRSRQNGLRHRHGQFRFKVPPSGLCNDVGLFHRLYRTAF